MLKIILIIIIYIAMIFIKEPEYKKEFVEKILFSEIENKCYELDTTEFLDYLSNVDYSNFNELNKVLVSAMRDFNIAIDPLYQGKIKAAIKNLNKMNDKYNSEGLWKYIKINANISIVDLEYECILKYKYDNRSSLYFGRLNNSTPISFQLIDKIGDDYLLLQESTFNLKLKEDEVYKDGICVLKENNEIKRSFKLEEKLIKDIFILSDEELEKYKKSNKRVYRYLSVELNKNTVWPDEDINNAKSENCEFDDISGGREYWIRDNEENIANKIIRKGKIQDAELGETGDVRLAILVKGRTYEK